MIWRGIRPVSGKIIPAGTANGDGMKRWRPIWILVLSLVLTATGAAAVQKVIIASNPSVNGVQAEAFINWSDQVLRAVGRGEVGDAGKAHHAPFHAMAKARQNAYHRLLITAKSIQLTPAMSVSDFLGTNDILLAEFENLLKQAEVVQTEFLSTGPVEIILEVSLTGKFSKMLLPDTVTRLEKIESEQSSIPVDTSEYTGLVVDARGLRLVPAMCFQVLDEKGKEVYGPAYASRENVVAAGMCQYVSSIGDIENSERVGGNPLMVKGIKVHPPGASNIVISDTDAGRLRGSVEHLAFLKNCRVVVVMDPQRH